MQGRTSAAGAGGAGAANAQGQRTRKLTPAGTTVYHYDLAGNLISETQGNGTSIRDYVWQDATPLAQIEAGAPETVIFLHTDHLQTPRLATNTAGIAVWRWEGEAFGNTPPNEDVDGDGQSTTINLRFPGQYFDGETGWHYNWMRYYDSTVGRYTRNDPAGLDVGVNTYAYALGSPLVFIDEEGLCPGVIDTGNFLSVIVSETEFMNGKKCKRQSQNKARFRGVLIRSSGSCDNKCENRDGLKNCVYNLTFITAVRIKPCAGVWSPWQSFPNRELGELNIPFNCTTGELILDGATFL